MWNLWSSYRYELRKLNFREMSFKGTSKTLVKSQYVFCSFKGIHSAHIFKGLIMPSLQILNTWETSALQLFLFTEQRNQARHVIIVITNFQQPLSKPMEYAESFTLLSFSCASLCPSLKSMVLMVYCQSEKCDLIVP